MSGADQRGSSRGLKLVLGVGTVVLGGLGLVLWLFLGMGSIGLAILALGGIMLAFLGYLNTGDKAIAGILIFVCIVVIILQIVTLLAP